MDESRPGREAADERIADFAATLAAMGVNGAPWARQYLEVSAEQLPQILGPTGAIVLVAYSPEVGVVLSLGASVSKVLTSDEQREVMDGLLESGLRHLREGDENLNIGFTVEQGDQEPED